MERDHNRSPPKNEGRGGSGNESDSHSSNTPPPMPIVVSSSFPVGGFVPSSPQETSGRKRSRGEERGESSSVGGFKGKKKGELTDPPSSEPKCATCGKTFGSWKAVFGHLRSHPERDYRGAFPPPKIWEEMLQQREAARQQQRQHGEYGEGSNTAAAARSSAPLTCSRGIGIDLNDPEEPHKEGFPFDLNMMPAPETTESEEEDDKDDKKSSK